MGFIEPSPTLSIGWKRYIFVGVLVLTWIFWNVAVFHCTFMKIGYEGLDWKDRQDTGIFTEPQYDGDKIYACSVYHPDADLDGAFKAAQFFGAMGFIFHTSALLTVVFVELCVLWRAALLWNIVRGLLIAAFVCSLLIFSIFGTDHCSDSIKCAPGGGGIVAIFNIVFLMVAMALSWLTDVPQNPYLFCRRWAEQDTVPEQQATKDTGNDLATPPVDPTSTEGMDEPATPIPLEEPIEHRDVDMKVVPMKENPSKRSIVVPRLRFHLRLSTSMPPTKNSVRIRTKT